MTISQDIRDAICAQLAEGKSLREVCRQPGMPTAPAVCMLAMRDDSFREQYARARDIGADVEFDALEEFVAEQPPTNALGSVDNGWVAWKRLQVDTAKWSLARKAPKKYGERVTQEHTGEGGGPIVGRIELVALK